MTDGPQPWFASKAEGAEKRHAPAALRNRDAIAAVLRDILPERGLVLELASGSGEHIVHFAGLFPALEWQPSDPDAAALSSIAAWSGESGLSNIRTPLAIDVQADNWGMDRADAILCINMVHISPWEATVGLMQGAARLLPSNAPLYLYGPYLRSDVATAPSNLAFDQSLRIRNPAWGLRRVDDMMDLAQENGMLFCDLVEMPANNISLIFSKS
ncbi:DUF938 domain-containing protein [Rhizorhapis sp. SPR117]|uniref:DUF938 domain-containing protein n=1 Tax=Rhizorhapis sp. SPR117 TaxID=2912611 RepID=UPI001F256BE4|nr:class I SAM-dependent methyltransferase [Rhizorhapis sp. SPR117]